MKERIEMLKEEHSSLEVELQDLLAFLGTPRGCGTQDQTELNLPAFQDSLTRFMRRLRDHERAEESLLMGDSRRLGVEARGRTKTLYDEHNEIWDLLNLLAAVTGYCDGTHVYSVRLVMDRFAEALRLHFRDEEEELFPYLLSRSKGEVPAASGRWEH